MSDGSNQVYLAIDLGASSARVLASVWDGERLEFDDVHRFPTPSVEIGQYWYWDILSLYSEILTGIAKAVKIYGRSIVSAGVDTWGVDYGLIDESGELLANPICYRDGRTDGMMERLDAKLTNELIYRETGIQFLFFNTSCQLAAEQQQKRCAYKNAHRLLFLPDLLNFWLSGRQATERSIASTSQMLNPVTKDWSAPILGELGIESRFMGEVIESGTSLGVVREQVAQKIGHDDLRVIAVPGHDTACAFMALPGSEPDFAILSSGTWSLMGLELKEPNCSQEAMKAGFSNEIGYGGSVRFLKNICGFWLLEECRRQWSIEGDEVDYASIVEMAEGAEPLRSLIDPDDALFARPGDMPSRILSYCSERGEPAPLTREQMVRCIFDSLAMKYRHVFEKLERFSDRPLRGLFVLGGGARNELLNQLTADAIGLPVVAGASEATAVGNVMAQMIASGSFSDLAEAREKVAPSFGSTSFNPSSSSKFRESRDRFESLLTPKLAAR